MFGVRHHITKEFPSHTHAITDLKKSNPQFARLLDEYDATDKKIYGLAMQSLPVPDHYMDSLKKKRVVLKDRIYRALNHTT